MRRHSDHGLRNLIVAAVALTVVMVAASGRAQDARVVVVDADPRVADAIDVALSPWSLVVLRVPGPPPEPDIVTAVARSHTIAREHHAGAVIWLEPPAPSSVHPSLWVYDSETQQLAVRPLGASAPFDEAGAAAVALSVKTILRGSALDASPRPPPPPPVSAPPDTPLSLRILSKSGPAPALVTEVSEKVWRVEAEVIAKTPTGATEAFELAGGLGLSLWPRSSGGRFGAGATVKAGPGVAVDTPLLRGQLVHGSVEATARLRAKAAPGIVFELQTGPALVIAALDGKLRLPEKPVHALRINGAWDAIGLLDVQLSSRVGVAAFAGASAAMFRAQNYTVDGVSVAQEPWVCALLGLRLSMGLN